MFLFQILEFMLFWNFIPFLYLFKLKPSEILSPPQNSHFFVRSKRCHYSGKCGSLYDCDYLGNWRISHRRYRWISKKEDQESPKKPQIKSCIAIVSKNKKKWVLSDSMLKKISVDVLPNLSRIKRGCDYHEWRQ